MRRLDLTEEMSARRVQMVMRRPNKYHSPNGPEPKTPCFPSAGDQIARILLDDSGGWLGEASVIESEMAVQSMSQIAKCA